MYNALIWILYILLVQYIHLEMNNGHKSNVQYKAMEAKYKNINKYL